MHLLKNLPGDKAWRMISRYIPATNQGLAQARQIGEEMSKKEYFAYGSNLNFEQMAYRCPEATAVGIAKLDGYELAFRRGYLTILPKEGASVEG